MFKQLNEFFAEAKSEFKKISWPSPDEIRGSTVVVCVTIAFVMVLLFAYDSAIAPAVKLLLKVK